MCLHAGECLHAYGCEVYVYLIESVHTLSFAGADITGVSPALTWHSSAAACYFRCVLRLWSQTLSIYKFGVAVAHADI